MLNEQYYGEYELASNDYEEDLLYEDELAADNDLSIYSIHDLAMQELEESELDIIDDEDIIDVDCMSNDEYYNGNSPSKTVITKHGHVYKIEYDKKKVKKLDSIDKNGYKVLSVDDKLTKLHRLVAKHFIPNPNDFPVINHKDSNKLNNSIDNLEWCTQKHNVQHAWKNGRCANVRNSKRKLSKKQAEEIREKRINENLTLEELAKQYNVTPMAISNVINNKSYR